MEDFKRLFVVTDGEGSRTSFVVAVKDNELQVYRKSGRHMYIGEIKTALGLFLEEYEKNHGRLERYKRKRFYRFCYREGVSGCRDIFIEIQTSDGFPERKFLIHESCFGKCGGLSGFVYDFLDLCVARMGSFSVIGGYYVYNKENDPEFEDTEIKIIEPRQIIDEEGWTDPGKQAKGMVRL